jgi:hypothetical protein
VLSVSPPFPASHLYSALTNRFMAVSRMIDIELTEVEKKRLEEAEAGQATQMGQR